MVAASMFSKKNTDCQCQIIRAFLSLECWWAKRQVPKRQAKLNHWSVKATLSTCDKTRRVAAVTFGDVIFAKEASVSTSWGRTYGRHVLAETYRTGIAILSHLCGWTHSMVAESAENVTWCNLSYIVKKLDTFLSFHQARLKRVPLISRPIVKEVVSILTAMEMLSLIACEYCGYIMTLCFC